jgi:hypothetical protein
LSERCAPESMAGPARAPSWNTSALGVSDTHFLSQIIGLERHRRTTFCRHPGDPLPEGNMTGGLTDRNNVPLGTWQFRFIDWFGDLGFMQQPGVETTAARDVANRVANPPKPSGQGGRGGGE